MPEALLELVAFGRRWKQDDRVQSTLSNRLGTIVTLEAGTKSALVEWDEGRVVTHVALSVLDRAPPLTPKELDERRADRERSNKEGRLLSRR